MSACMEDSNPVAYSGCFHEMATRAIIPRSALRTSSAHIGDRQ